jgi:hypothetical protein
VEVGLRRVRLEDSRRFGGCWAGLSVLGQLGLNELLERLLPTQTGVEVRKRGVSRATAHRAIRRLRTRPGAAERPGDGTLLVKGSRA